MADDLIVIHRSGKIQTIQIDSSNDPIEQVSFRRGKENVTQIQQQQPLVAPAVVVTTPPKASAVTQSPQKAAEMPKTADTPNVKVKWATPVDSARY